MIENVHVLAAWSHPRFCFYSPSTGGPDMNDQYRDDCQNYKQAEVAIDYVSSKWIHLPLLIKFDPTQSH